MTEVLLMIRVRDTEAAAAIAALKPFASSIIETFVPYQAIQNEDEVIDEDLAEAIAAKIAPTPKQSVRKELLEGILWQWDSMYDTNGDGDASLRVGLAAISKSLKPLAPHLSSPIELICHRTREFDLSGSYRATVYKPTKLGERVREILVQNGKIK